MSGRLPESLEPYRERESDLTQELIAYFRQAAASIEDADRLEALLDDLCEADDALITKPQAEARAWQIQYVRNLLRDRSRVEVLEEIYDDAMQAARAVGGEYYAQSATRLTELQAQAHAVLDRQDYDQFPTILAQMKSIGEHASRRE
jgi:hypothetical protein